MTENKFKTMRHIQCVQAYLNAVIRELLKRGEEHDNSKLQPPEVEIFEEYTPKLRGVTYGSKEYYDNMKCMEIAIDHHNEHQRHHPEHHENGIWDMTLIDLIEMLCDWKAATLRHDDGDIKSSIMKNASRFDYHEGIINIFMKTADWIEEQDVVHWAEES